MTAMLIAAMASVRSEIALVEMRMFNIEESAAARVPLSG